MSGKWFFAALALPAIALLLGCEDVEPVGMRGKCVKSDIREFTSPDGKHLATVYREQCEQPPTLNVDVTGASTDLTVTPAFFAQRVIDDTKPFVWPEVRVEWLSSTELTVRYPPGYSTSCQAHPVEGVRLHCLEDGSLPRNPAW